MYVVTMYRFGRKGESHSYVLGIYSKKQKAITAATRECDSRGDKYLPEILFIEPDSKNKKTTRTIKEFVKEVRGGEVYNEYKDMGLYFDHYHDIKC